MERLTDAPVLRVLRGSLDPDETAALVAVLVIARAEAAAVASVPARRTPERPVWRPFTAHSRGGWGRM